jgi:hypothetical protein
VQVASPYLRSIALQMPRQARDTGESSMLMKEIVDALREKIRLAKTSGDPGLSSAVDEKFMHLIDKKKKLQLLAFSQTFEDELAKASPQEVSEDGRQRDVQDRLQPSQWLRGE